MTDSIRYRPDDVRWFDQQVREPNIAHEADAIRQDMDNALTLSPLEVVLLGEAIQEGRTRFFQEEAKRALTITEAPQCWDEDEWRDQALSRHRRKYGRGIVLAVAIMAGCALAIIGVLYAVKHGWRV